VTDLHKLSPLRVAVRPDFDTIDVALPENAPTRTEDGRPWVRWAKQGDYSGWYAVGSRKPQRVGTPSFWDAVFLVACECAGGTFDQVHCCGRGVLALGALGVTMRSGYAQLLLHCCLMANPARFVEIMSPVVLACGAYTKATENSPSGVALCALGKYAMNEAQMRALVTAGSDSMAWTRQQQARAKVWVSCCSQLLRDESMDKAQLSFLQEVSAALLTDTTRETLKWPRDGRNDGWWQYTKSQQMLWALALVMSLYDEEQTERLIVDSKQFLQQQPDAPLGSEYVLAEIGNQVQDVSYEDTFRSRCELAMRLLSEMMEVTL
jgi:hypothetical protein